MCFHCLSNRLRVLGLTNWSYEQLGSIVSPVEKWIVLQAIYRPKDATQGLLQALSRISHLGDQRAREVLYIFNLCHSAGTLSASRPGSTQNNLKATTLY